MTITAVAVTFNLTPIEGHTGNGYVTASLANPTEVNDSLSTLVPVGVQASLNAWTGTIDLYADSTVTAGTAWLFHIVVDNQTAGVQTKLVVATQAPSIAYNLLAEAAPSGAPVTYVTGPGGPPGAAGPTGPTGPGVAVGGTPGQVLTATSTGGSSVPTTAWATPSGGGGGGAVTSVFSRTGVVAAATGDYSVGQVTGAAPLASPALTGTPTAPTATALDASTKVATTAYTDAATAVEKARAQGVEGTNATAISTETTRATTAEGLAALKANNLSDLATPSTARTNLGLGTAAVANKVAAGTAGVLDATDATTTNSRTPTGTAGGALTGTYPNPTLAVAQPSPASTVTGPDAYGATAVVGSSALYARQDHDHGLPATPVTSAVAGTGIAVSAATGAVTVSVTNAVATVQENVHTVATSSTTQTIPDVTSATVNTVTLTANCTLTFPTAAAGKSFLLALVQDATGSRTVTWPGTVKWSAATAPTLTTTAAKTDLFSFACIDGTNWLGVSAGANF